jgi:hypothetical protein
MTTNTPGSPVRQRNTRALLIQQQRVPQGDLPLPLLLRSPFVALLWAVVLSTVVAALALGRTRVPRTARGVVVASPSGPDSLTPILLLPSSARAYVKPGQVAAIDTGGTDALTLVITSVEPVAIESAAARNRFAGALEVAMDGPRVVAHLGRCHGTHCLSLASGSSYAAVAALGSRSLASYALPRS